MTDDPTLGRPSMSPPDPNEYGPRPRGSVADFEEGARRYNEAAAIELKGSIRGSMALLSALFFRPTRFMLSYAVHVSFGQVFVVMWLFAAIAILDQEELRSVTGSTISPFKNTDWASIWGIAAGGGLVRGMVWYGIGGLWFRARLFMCGVRGAPWAATGRVFAFLHFPVALSGLLYYIAASFAFDDFQAYVDTDETLWIALSFIPVTITMYTSVIAYASARGVFHANRLWAIIWFLFAPIAMRLAFLVGIGVLAWFKALSPAPDLKSTADAVTPIISLRHPGNWVVTINEPESGPPTLVELSPTGHDALISLEIVYFGPESDRVAEMEAWFESIDFPLQPNPTPLSRWGSFEGDGYLYSSINAGNSYDITLFFSPLMHGGWLCVREIIHADSTDLLKPGIEFVRNSATVKDPALLPPDLVDPVWLDAEGVTFQTARNWWNTHSVEDGQPAPFTLASESTQGSWFSVYGYPSELGSRQELTSTLEILTVQGRLAEERPLDRWLGLEGIGIEGIQTADSWEGSQGRDRRIRVLISPRADGHFLEIRSVEYLDTEELTRPAFALIESTFKVGPLIAQPEESSPIPQTDD
jgi:hypothetical protein